MGKHKGFEAEFLMPPLSLSLSLMYCIALDVEFSLNWSACPTSIFTEKIITMKKETYFFCESHNKNDWTVIHNSKLLK